MRTRWVGFIALQNEAGIRRIPDFPNMRNRIVIARYTGFCTRVIFLESFSSYSPKPQDHDLYGVERLRNPCLNTLACLR